MESVIATADPNVSHTAARDKKVFIRRFQRSPYQTISVGSVATAEDLPFQSLVPTQKECGLYDPPPLLNTR